jgi:hypothetical protein
MPQTIPTFREKQYFFKIHKDLANFIQVFNRQKAVSLVQRAREIGGKEIRI